MCDPLSLTMFAVSAGSQYMGYQAEKAQYKAGVQAADAQTRFFEQNKQAAIKSQIEQSAQTEHRLRQEDKTRAAEAVQIDQQAQAERATALMSAGENGVSGLSVSGLLSEFYTKQGAAKAELEAEGAMARQQANMDLKGIQAQAEDRIRSVQKGVKPIKPSALAAGIKIAASGVDAYNGYNANKKGR